VPYKSSCCWRQAALRWRRERQRRVDSCVDEVRFSRRGRGARVRSWAQRGNGRGRAPTRCMTPTALGWASVLSRQVNFHSSIAEVRISLAGRWPSGVFASLEAPVPPGFGALSRLRRCRYGRLWLRCNCGTPLASWMGRQCRRVRAARGGRGPLGGKIVERSSAVGSCSRPVWAFAARLDRRIWLSDAGR
jgi:hypothetical protein